jgi:rhodanese-related sulfurtransferase
MDFFVRHWEYTLIAIASGAMLLWPLLQRRISSVKEIGTLEATQLVNGKNAVLLDVRETAEYQGGRLPNAVHVPVSQIASRAAELAKYTSRPVIAYCAAGNRSRMAGGALAKAGFTEVYSLTGGYRAWKDAGLPVEK